MGLLCLTTALIFYLRDIMLKNSTKIRFCVHALCMQRRKYKLIHLYNIQRSNKIANVEMENTILYVEQYSVAVHSSDHITHRILPRSMRA